MSERKKQHPPRIGENLFRLLLPESEKSSLLGDYEELFKEMAIRRGWIIAGLWYWIQILSALLSTIRDSTKWGLVMIRNYMKISTRNLKKHKEYSSINIAGLAIGMAVFILVSLYVQYEMSFDRYHENSDRIYRIIKENIDDGMGMANSSSVFIPSELGPAMVEEFPEVISAARFFRWHRGENYFSFGDKGIYEKMYYVEPEFFEIFSIPFIHGNSKTVLNDPLSLVLSERLAEKHFGYENPVGKQLTLRRGSSRLIYTITGVFKTMPDNSHLVMDLIIPFRNFLTSNSSSSSPTYILLKEGADPKNIEQKLPEWLNRRFFSVTDDRFRGRYSLQPLTAIHLHSRIGDNTIYSNYNDIRNIYIYASVAILILIIVCLNYMNLTAARSFQRHRKIGIRKVVGAKRKQLFGQFLAESFLITIFSLTVSMLLAILFLPGFNFIIGGNLRLTQMQNPTFFLVIASVVVFVGIVGGCYPAFYMSSLKSVNILKGTSKKNMRGSLVRNILVISQFSIAIMILISTFVISSQLQFINKKDMGYDKERIVVLSHLYNHREVHQNRVPIKTELLRNPNITAVSYSNELPNHIISRGRVDLQNKNSIEPIPFNVFTVDEDYVDLYGIEIIEGTHFLGNFHSGSTKEVLINQTAAKALGEATSIGKEFGFWSNDIGRIVGIVNDFHSLSLHHQVPPTFIVFNPTYNDYISIKINGMNISEPIDYIRKTMKKFAPNYQFDYHFFNEIFERDYQNEMKMEKIFRFIMLLSIALACMGLVGIATYSTQLRIKEIGIRKVLGASVLGVSGIFSRDFTKCVLFANFFAWPIAYFTMNKWLQNFAYRINLNVWIFILSGLAALAIALLTVGYQSIKAATANPVDSLRYE